MSCHFAYRTMNGDGTIVARVASVENNPGPRPTVMIRETLNADSKHASALVAPSGIGFLWRTSTVGSSSYDGVTGFRAVLGQAGPHGRAASPRIGQAMA